MRFEVLRGILEFIRECYWIKIVWIKCLLPIYINYFFVKLLEVG